MDATRLTEIVTAIMHTSGLMPDEGMNYYEDYNMTQIISFLNGLCAHFKIPNNNSSFHFTNLSWMDGPQETLEYVKDHYHEWMTS